VADAFDALTHDRPYRAGRSIKLAIEELRREAGRQFDAQVVEAIASALEHEPAPLLQS
jgi:HD-GYP domain-containing protein (c-di-GMP phosphodiesterase class II)